MFTAQDFKQPLAYNSEVCSEFTPAWLGTATSLPALSLLLPRISPVPRCSPGTKTRAPLGHPPQSSATLAQSLQEAEASQEGHETPTARNTPWFCT